MRSLPNKPAVNYIERYKLALLSLRPEKCRPIRFFMDFDEKTNDEEEFLLSSQIDTVVGTYEVTENNVLVPVDEDAQMDDCDGSAEDTHQAESQVEIDMEIDNLEEKLRVELERLQKLAKEAASSKDTYRRSLKAMVQRLKRPSTPAQAIETFMRFKAASMSCVSRRTNIKVQPTAIQRRKEGKLKGAKRIRAGRPYKHEANGKTKPKRCLAASIKGNKTHVKSHQRK